MYLHVLALFLCVIVLRAEGMAVATVMVSKGTPPRKALFWSLFCAFPQASAACVGVVGEGCGCGRGGKSCRVYFHCVRQAGRQVRYPTLDSASEQCACTVPPAPSPPPPPSPPSIQQKPEASPRLVSRKKFLCFIIVIIIFTLSAQASQCAARANTTHVALVCTLHTVCLQVWKQELRIACLIPTPP